MQTGQHQNAREVVSNLTFILIRMHLYSLQATIYPILALS